MLNTGQVSLNQGRAPDGDRKRQNNLMRFVRVKKHLIVVHTYHRELLCHDA